MAMPENESVALASVVVSVDFGGSDGWQLRQRKGRRLIDVAEEMVSDLRLEVQSLIERCLLLHMDREQCVKALARHARIRPLVTLTGRHGMIYPRNGRRSQWK
nr:Angiotensin-converting enzyme 2 [Ipomoea batatas]